jgi:hypothetical protein
MNGPFVIDMSQVGAGVVPLQHQFVILRGGTREDMKIRNCVMPAPDGMCENIISCTAGNPVITADAVENVATTGADHSVGQLVAGTCESTLH